MKRYRKLEDSSKKEMAELVIEPIGPHRNNLHELTHEIEKAASLFGDVSQSKALIEKWKASIADSAGFVLLDASDCIGLLLYSAEYDLRFSSFLSPSSAEKLPKSATVFACHVLERARDVSTSNEQLLLQSAISRLRTIKSIETIAVQTTPLYELDLRKTLANMGFLSCRRVRMQCSLIDSIPQESTPEACKIETPVLQEADDLRAVIYHGYFAEIDGYLFPDIDAVCSQRSLFDEFLTSASVDRPASVLAKKDGFPCGCVLVLSNEDSRLGLIGVVAVIPAMRQRGIAQAMMLRVLHRLKEHKRDRAALAVTVENKHAFKLYSSLGFQEIGSRKAISVWRRSVSRPRITRRG
jgi:ribosomal protein S18 acetylase RimI-like enzyme